MIRFFAIAFLVVLVGCQSPTFTPYVDTQSRITRAQVAAEIPDLFPGATVSGLDDSTYTLVSADWLVANIGNFRHWAWEYLPDYQGQSLDCDNFGKILREVINVQAGRAKVPAAPLAPAIYVRQRVTWANVRGTPIANHVVNGVATDRGYFVIEPQSLTTATPVYAPLADYPNAVFHLDF